MIATIEILLLDDNCRASFSIPKSYSEFLKMSENEIGAFTIISNALKNFVENTALVLLKKYEGAEKLQEISGPILRYGADLIPAHTNWRQIICTI
jgi:hypothetical protein